MPITLWASASLSFALEVWRIFMGPEQFLKAAFKG
jgi:hypothetical protein